MHDGDARLGHVNRRGYALQEETQRQEVRPAALQIAGLQRSGTTWMRRLLRANFNLQVRSHCKHHMADAVIGRCFCDPQTHKDEKPFAQHLRDHNEFAVVMRKGFEKWVESVNRVPGILKPLYDGITIHGKIPDGMIERARGLHSAYYASWEANEDVSAIVSYEQALKNPVLVLSWLQRKLDLKGVRRTAEWDLIDTWLKGPERERYIPA